MEDDFAKLIKTIFSSKKFPVNIRLLLISGTQLIYINNGHIEFRSFTFQFASFLSQDRGKILHIFAEFEFIIFELIRLKIQGFEHENSKMLIQLIEAVSMNRLLRLLRDFKIIDEVLFASLDNLFKTRNQIAHDFSLSEVEYNSKKLILLNTQTNFLKFKNQISETWKKLVDVYSLEQEKIDIPVIIKQIEDFQPQSNS